MKRAFLRSLPAVAVMLFALPALAQNDKGVAVNNDGRKPNPFAILDVGSYYPGAAIQKGMLIPRVTLAERDANIGTGVGLPEGLTVYQTTGVPGFYVIMSGVWVRVDNGANAWSINGNNVGIPANDFFGTRDDQDLVFKTNNTQVMRVEGTNGTRYVHIGTNTTVPNEQLDVPGGAIRINNPAPGSWAAPVKYAATNSQGSILFRPVGTTASQDSLESTFVPLVPQNKNVVMWNGHWGNIDGTGPTNLTLATATSGGWTRLENEYEERFTKSYTQQGEPLCGAGSVTIPAVTIAPANYTNTLAQPGRDYVSIYPHSAFYRVRHQHMYLKSELNVELNQLGGNALATGGLCSGQPITSIAFYIAAVNNTKNVPLNGMTITIKHVPLGLNNLSAGFDNSTDPAQSCYLQTLTTTRPSVAGWETFAPLDQPFVWDGARNILVEIAYTAAPGAVATPPTVLYGPSPGAALLTASWNTSSNSVPCINTAGVGACPGTSTPGGMPWNNPTCGVIPTNGGTSQYRPVVKFTGTVATAPASFSGNNSYIWYRGGFIAEATTTPPWGRQITPYFSFRGPGTISAEKGVYDNGILLNDHVFDRAFDGAVKPTDAETFGAVRDLSIQEMADHTRLNRHLPTMKGRESWRVERGFSLGDLTNQLWTTAETQALYVTELNDRLNVLELLTNDRPLDPAESELAKSSIRSMNDYTEAEKGALMNAIDQRTVTTNQR